MPRVLHILTRQDDDLSRHVIDHQRHLGDDVEIDVCDLTQPPPDYTDLLQRIFAAESVATW